MYFFFSFPVLLLSVWNVSRMAAAAATRLDLEVTLRMEVLHSRLTGWKEVGP